MADTNRVGFHPYIGVNDVMGSLCRPNIGVSSDGTALFVSFSVPSDEIGGTIDSTVFMDIWLAASIDGGLTWPQLAKINPVSPRKDWRYVSMSKWNDRTSTNYFCNMVALRGHVPGSFLNSSGNPESNEEFWFIRAFVVFGSVPPAPPSLLTPLNNSTYLSQSPLLDWSDVSGVTYNLQVSTNLGFTTNLIDLSGLTSSGYQIPGGLLQTSTTYYWRVCCTNTNGTGWWSDIYNFTTLGVPVVPVLISPANSSSISTLLPLLDWNEGIMANSYGLQVSTNIGFTTTIINLSGITASQYQLAADTLQLNTVYYWRVNATNTYGTNAWCTPWNFTTPGIPSAPVLLYPANGSYISSLIPLLDWNNLPYASSYTVQVSLSNSFSSFVVNQSGISNSSYQIPNGTFTGNTLYYWRVRGVNIIGTGIWSNVWYFYIIPTSVLQSSGEIPKENKMYNNYPNPFNPMTKIKFDLPKSSGVRITVFDVTGKEVAVIVNETLQAGSYQTEWDASAYPSGVYFYRIVVRHGGSSTADFSETKRMMLIK